jgi:hypothetical protein
MPREIIMAILTRTGREPHVDSPTYRALAALALAVPLVLALLALAVPGRVSDPVRLVQSSAIAALLVLLVVVISPRLPRHPRALLRAAGSLWLGSWAFSAAAQVQHLLVDGWMDAQLIAFETRFTGRELSLLLEDVTVPVLTEWFMASYVLYVPLLPVTAVVAYRYRGEEALYTYLLVLLAAYVLCYAGFALYPVASQMYFMPHAYTVPLRGGPFTALAEFMRGNLHYAGGSLPSPHCAAGTVMLVTMFRSHRGWAWATAPLLVCILPATVYGRFHYLSDGLAGIAVAVLVLSIHRACRAHRTRTAGMSSHTPAGTNVPAAHRGAAS